MHLKEEEESRTVENFDLGEFSFDAACWWEPWIIIVRNKNNHHWIFNLYGSLMRYFEIS